VFLQEYFLGVLAVRLQNVGVNITCQTLRENVRTISSELNSWDTLCIISREILYFLDLNFSVNFIAVLGFGQLTVSSDFFQAVSQFLTASVHQIEHHLHFTRSEH